MPRTRRGTPTTCITHETRKNGDKYVFEQTYLYDPETKRNRKIASKLLGKIPKGESEMVPTRAKRADGTGPEPKRNSKEKASRTHGSLMDILAWAGYASGIDMDVRAAMSEADTNKLLSLVRFLIATGGDTIPNIEYWQLTHPVPCAEKLSADVCYDLIERLGRSEDVRQRLFAARARRLDDHPLIAFDSTLISTYSRNQIEARYSREKDNGGLKAIKYLTLYDATTRQPITFSKEPGNLSDVTALKGALKQLEAAGVKQPQIVTDNGFWSETNIAEMCFANLDFITLAKASIEWISPEVDEAMSTIHRGDNQDPETGHVYVTTRKVSRTFSRIRQRASRKKGLQAGDSESFTRPLYLHICYDPQRKEAADSDLFACIRSVAEDLTAGFKLTELSQEAQNTAARFLIVDQTRTGRIRSVEWNYEACEKACRHHGVFVIVASKEKDRFEALRKYRKREAVEEYFRLNKQEADGSRPRSWYNDNLMGRMIVQFVALCTEDFLRERIRDVKAELDEELHTVPSPLTKTQLDFDRKLLNWLKKTSFQGLMHWFDAYENFEVPEAVRRIRWNTETTQRDKRFLELLMGDSDW